MPSRDNYDDLDFSDDRHAERPKRRIFRAERHKPRKKLSADFDNYVEYDDDFNTYDDWGDPGTDDFDPFDNH